jgi:cell wall-associated NlpC family hydrolase
VSLIQVREPDPRVKNGPGEPGSAPQGNVPLPGPSFPAGGTWEKERVWHVRTPLPGIKSRFRGSVTAIAVGVLATVGLATYAGTAGAAPQPSISQVQAEVNQLTAKYDQANQQYDQAAQQVSAARVKLAKLNRQVATDEAQFTRLSRDVAQIAATSYEDSNMTSVAALLTSSNPQTVLSSASMLQQLSGTRNQQMKQFLVAARQLSASQQQAQRTKDALTAVEQHKQHQRDQAQQARDNKQALLNNLTAQQQQQVAAASIGTGAVAVTAFTGSTATQAGQAAAFAVNAAMQQCPYAWGGTGPCQNGYDCSGLVQAAWASAGVAIPRTTYDDWASLPHVSTSSIEVGDLLLYSGESHVAIYVGNGMIVDAPQAGMPVEEISMNSSWYASNLDGVVRP